FEWSPVEDMAELKGEPVDEFEIERGFTFEAVVAEELPSTANAEIATPADDDRVKDARTQELESVDFYIAQGYADIAVDTLDLLEQQFGKHLDIDLRRQQLETGAESAAIVMDAELPADASAIEQMGDSPAVMDYPEPVL